MSTTDKGKDAVWTKHKSRSRPGKVYYYNRKTGEKTWTRPKDYRASSLKRDMEQHRKKNRSAKRVKRDDDASTVQVAHILQKHTKSRKPFNSWKKIPITREIDAARENLKRFRAQIMERSDAAGRFELFKSIAGESSDCSSARNEGVMKPFGRGKMQKNFEDASFRLKKDEISGIVETKSGCHLIYCIKSS